MEQAVEHKNFSQVEYFTVLPVSGDSENLALFLKTSNDEDNRLFNIRVWENNEKIIPYFNQSIHINSSKEFYNILPISKDNTYLVECWIMDYETGGLIDSKTIIINKEYIENLRKKAGL